MRTKSLNFFLYNHFAGFCSTNTNKTLHTYEFCYLFKKCKLFSVTTVVYYNTKERARIYTRKQKKNSPQLGDDFLLVLSRHYELHAYGGDVVAV